MRLIDADELKTIKSIQMADYNSIETIQKWIDSAPTVDAVEVVRCKDCVYPVMTIDGQVKYCKEHDPRCRDKLYYNADFFCADGERREVTE